MTSEKKKVFGLSFLSVFLWASAFPLTKVAQQQFTSIPLGFLRCTVAAIFLIIIGKCCHIRLPQKKHIPLFFVSGGLGFTGYMITFNTGILTLTSATSSIIIAVTPILTAIVASNLYKEKIKPIGWAAIAAAFIGVLILLLWEGVFSINIGLIWTVGAAIVFCGYNIMTRKLSAMGYNALQHDLRCHSAWLLGGGWTASTGRCKREPHHCTDLSGGFALRNGIFYMGQGNELRGTHQ